MSISLPGMSTLRNMGNSSPSPRAASTLTQMIERSTEVVGRESVTDTWSLAHGRGWPEVRQSLRPGRTGVGTIRKFAKAE